MQFQPRTVSTDEQSKYQAKEAQVSFVDHDDPKREIIEVGPATICVLEDGSHTENRIGIVSVTLGPKVPGPIPMWHRLNDSTFYILEGQLRFFTSSPGPPDNSGVSARIITSRIVQAGDYIIVPPNAIHNFDNPFDEKASFLNTFTPANYIDAIRVIAAKTQKAVDEGRFPLDPEEQEEVMKGWATFPPPVI